MHDVVMDAAKAAAQVFTSPTHTLIHSDHFCCHILDNFLIAHLHGRCQDVANIMNSCDISTSCLMTDDIIRNKGEFLEQKKILIVLRLL